MRSTVERSGFTSWPRSDANPDTYTRGGNGAAVKVVP
jgi:hypothetical protein